MNVLSLFDGISCGLVALKNIGVSVSEYVAYEVDKNAIEISKQNHPEIKHMGTVIGADFTVYTGFDLLIGGPPCQDLSINTKDRKGLSGERSGLFWEMVRAIKEVRPKYFLLENNYKMPQKDRDIITKEMGVEPILIDSALFSGQKRERYYWTNIPLPALPSKYSEQRVADILEDNTQEINYFSVANIRKPFENNFSHRPERIGEIGKGGQSERIYSKYGKSITLKANGGGQGAKGGLYLTNKNEVRKLTPIEFERLQTLPDDYTKYNTLGEIVSDSQRYKALGNGWTVDVIAHILKGLKERIEND